ncbi:hypothetical protein [Proteus mirabilis]|uniref:hypothetical protein n=1 Tax=Proteus mirabilis TaxID=584 RepID=UPI0034DCE11E
MPPIAIFTLAWLALGGQLDCHATAFCLVSMQGLLVERAGRLCHPARWFMRS